MTWLKQIRNKLRIIERTCKFRKASVARQIRLTFESLFAAKDHAGLGKFIFGCSSKEDGELGPLRYLPILEVVLEITTTELRKIQGEWMDAALN